MRLISDQLLGGEAAILEQSLACHKLVNSTLARLEAVQCGAVGARTTAVLEEFPHTVR